MSASLSCQWCSYLAIDAADLREHVALNHDDGLDPSGMWLREWALELPIDAADIAAATLARHRRIARRSGADPAVVDAPAYRALLSRHVSTDVGRHIAQALTAAPYIA